MDNAFLVETVEFITPVDLAVGRGRGGSTSFRGAGARAGTRAGSAASLAFSRRAWKVERSDMLDTMLNYARRKRGK